MKTTMVSVVAMVVAIVTVASAHHYPPAPTHSPVPTPYEPPHPVCSLPYFWGTVNGRANRAGNLVYSVEYFKRILGGHDNRNYNGPLDGGYRWINWDDHDIPFEFPRHYFNHYKGVTFSSDHKEFRVSNPYYGQYTHDRRFSTINRSESKNFITYTRKRLFTPIHDNEFTVRWVIPGKRSKALVRGFGAVFVGVDKPHTTKVVAYDIHGCKIAEEYVAPFEDGLSFLGIHFERAIIAKIEIVLGNRAINYQHYCGKRCGEDVVVVDDIYFSEPVRAYK